MKKMILFLVGSLLAFYTILVHGEDNKLENVKVKSNMERYCDQALKADQGEILNTITDAIDKALVYSIVYNIKQHPEKTLTEHDYIKAARDLINKEMTERYFSKNTPSKDAIYECEICHIQRTNPVLLSVHYLIIHRILRK